MSYTELITVENFGPYANIPSTTLTEEERQSTPYSQFFDLPINLPSEETIKALLPGNEIDPSLAILPEECGKLFTPGYLECENGYCVLPQGFGFSAVKIDMPEVKPEMLPFWFSWYLSSTVHYKTWLPDMHLEMRILERGHAATEDLGWGPELPLLGAGFMYKAEDFGITDPTEKDPDFVRFFGGATPIISPEDDPLDFEPKGYLSMVNYMRQKGTGMEWRVRTWMGVAYQNGEYILDPPPENPVPLIDRVRGMACHNAWEWSRMATLLPAVYNFAKENGLEAPNPRP